MATPKTLRSHAPDMLRLEELRIPIELGQLLSGDLVIPAIDGGPVELTVVVSDDGRNSFGELMQSEGDLQEAWPPLSGSLEALEELSLSVGPVRLGPIRLSSIEVTGSGARVRQTNLEPLGFFSDGVSFIGEPKGSAELRPQERDDVVLSVVDLAGDGSVREAHLVPKLEVRLQSGRVLALSAGAELRRQSLFAELRPVRSLLHVESSVTFDPNQGTTTLQLTTFTLFDSMLDATAALVLEDVAHGAGRRFGGGTSAPGAALRQGDYRCPWRARRPLAPVDFRLAEHRRLRRPIRAAGHRGRCVGTVGGDLQRRGGPRTCALS